MEARAATGKSAAESASGAHTVEPEVQDFILGRLNPFRRILPLLAIAVVVAAAPARQSPAQSLVRTLGLALTEASKYQSIAVNPTPLTRSLPPLVDLSGDMPPVGDQGSQGSCVAWSTSYATRTYLERVELKGQWNVNLPAAQFSPSFVYNQIAQGNCDTAVTIPNALNILSAEGAATLAMMPYSDADCRIQPSPQTLQSSAQFKISGYRRLDTQNLNDIKAHLAARLPVVVALDVDSTFMGLGQNQYWATKGPSVGTHAVVLVGYDEANQLFKFINSWGTNWGTNGYGYVHYNLFPSVAREAYIVTPFHSHDQTNQARESNVQLLRLDVSPAATPGLNAQIEYTLRGYSGHTGQIVLYFWYTNGQPVGATIQSLADISGNAAIATPVFAIQKDDYTNYVFTQFIPTADLNVPIGGNVVSGGQVIHQPLTTPLLVKAELFVDNYGMAQSQLFTFSVSR